MDMGDMQKPSPPVQMAQLDRLIGSWTGTAELVYPKPREGSEDAESSPTAHKCERVMDGMYLREEGWYEMGPDAKVRYVEYVTWDADAGAFRIFFFNDWGEFSTATGRPSVDGNSFTFRGRGTDAGGKTVRESGTMSFVDDSTVQWTWSQHDWLGATTFTVKGTSKRAR
jgi:hypothetical protein